MEQIVIYCDGSAIGNPGPGGWGAVITHEGKGIVLECGGFAAHTTNNRMELTAAIMSLRTLDAGSSVVVNTDSQYVINGITKWVFGWEKNGWQTTQKQDVVNKDLWQKLLLTARAHTVTWEHVRGHEGVTLNERADMIANGFARKEKTSLYDGNASHYKVFLETMPKARVVASSKSKKGKAYSYVSAIKGNVVVHRSWSECEARVKGKSALYKKVYSQKEEKDLIAKWSTV